MKKKALYLGHEYHIKTQSTVFLKELLQESFDMTYISFNPYTKEYTSDEKFDDNFEYDYLICFQIMPSVQELEMKYKYKKGVLFPMYDATIGLGDEWWEQYKDFVIICFSSTLKKKLKDLDIFSYYIQYFPMPDEIVNWGSEDSLYFWQRRENISLKTVKAVFPADLLNQVHLHKALDPEEKFDEDDLKLFHSIEISGWETEKKTIKNIMQNSALYMASRQYEGIGMGFLEAMAMGRCVIAPDSATMNEYIQDGYNGFLYKNTIEKKITKQSVRDCQRNAYEYIKKGYEKWQIEKENIVKWICNDIPPKISVIIFTENNMGDKVGLKRTLESIYRQTYPNIENIVIDNNSYDGTWEMIERYRLWGWIKYHHFERCINLSGMLKKAIDIAKGEYIIFLNPGSYFIEKDSIKKLIEFMEKYPYIQYAFGGYKCCSKNDIFININAPMKQKEQWCYDFQTLIIQNKCLKLLGPIREIRNDKVYEYIQKRLFTLQLKYGLYKDIYISLPTNENRTAQEEIINNPLVTIITVTKNVVRNGREKQFRQSINSIHSQTYKNIEHIIIDGYSDDGTIEIIKEYAFKGWLSYISEPDVDVWDAMRKAIDVAKGQYINYLNTDDYFTYENSVQKAVECLKREEADYFYSNANRIIKNSDNQECIEKCQYFGDVSTVPFGKGFCHQSLFVRKEVVKELDTFNFPYRLSLDNFQMLQLVIAKKKYAYSSENLVSFREGGLSTGEKTRDTFAQYFYDSVGKSLGMTLQDCSNIWVFKCFEECTLHYCIELLAKFNRDDWKKTYKDKFLEALEWAKDRIEENK